MSSSIRAWLYSVGFGVVGLLLLWWAMQQREAWREIAGSQFVMPVGRISIWHLTIVAAGFAFGLALTASSRGRSQPRVAILAVLAVVPLAGLLYFYAWILGWWATTLPLSLDRFLLDQGTQVAFPLVLGFLLSGMIGLGSDSS